MQTFAFYNLKVRGYSYKPNKPLMFGFLLSPVCVHWQCNDSHTCINRTCLSMYIMRLYQCLSDSIFDETIGLGMYHAAG